MKAIILCMQEWDGEERDNTHIETCVFHVFIRFIQCDFPPATVKETFYTSLNNIISLLSSKTASQTHTRSKFYARSVFLFYFIKQNISLYQNLVKICETISLCCLCKYKWVCVYFLAHSTHMYVHFHRRFKSFLFMVKKSSLKVMTQSCSLNSNKGRVSYALFYPLSLPLSHSHCCAYEENNGILKHIKCCSFSLLLLPLLVGNKLPEKLCLLLLLLHHHPFLVSGFGSEYVKIIFHIVHKIFVETRNKIKAHRE